jgi:hypothetical protein
MFFDEPRNGGLWQTFWPIAQWIPLSINPAQHFLAAVWLKPFDVTKSLQAFGPELSSNGIVLNQARRIAEAAMRKRRTWDEAYQTDNARNYCGGNNRWDGRGRGGPGPDASHARGK